MLIIDLLTGAVRAVLSSGDNQQLEYLHLLEWNAEGLWLSSAHVIWRIDPAAAEVELHEVWRAPQTTWIRDVHVAHALVVYQTSRPVQGVDPLQLVDWRTNHSTIILESAVRSSIKDVQITPDGQKVLWHLVYEQSHLVSDLMLYDRATDTTQLLWANISNAIRQYGAHEQYSWTNTNYYLWHPFEGLPLHQEPVLELDPATGAVTFPFADVDGIRGCVIAYDKLTCINHFATPSQTELFQQPLDATTPTLRISLPVPQAIQHMQLVYVAP